MEMSRRGKILAGVFGSALVLALGATALYQGTLAKAYRRQLEYAYQEALGQLASSTAAVAVDLEKACYAGSQNAVWEVSARLWRESGTAKAALSALPVGEAGLSGTSEFLSQVGDYAMSLARGGSAADRGKLADLLPYAQQLAQQTDLLESSVLSGEVMVDGLAFGYLDDDENGSAKQESPVVQAAAAVEEGDAQATEPQGGAGESAYAAMEEGFSGMPRLIYDGPFSSHLQDRSPQMLANLSHVSRQQARTAAATAMGEDPASLQEEGDENGTIPAYRFSCGDKTAAVTKQGGYLLYLAENTDPGGQTIGLQQAKQSARDMLEALGYHDMESSYHEISGNVCIFNFAAFQNGVVCYTDLVKVGVALDSGRVVQLDARGYLMNHHSRSLPAALVTQQDAAGLLSPLLAVESCRLALIPSAGQQERLCYEFLCRGQQDRRVLVYLNTATGAEEDLLLLQIGKNGTLTV